MAEVFLTSSADKLGVTLIFGDIFNYVSLVFCKTTELKINIARSSNKLCFLLRNIATKLFIMFYCVIVTVLHSCSS